MEILDEGFFNALTSKIKKVFGPSGDESKSTPEQDLYEETVGAVKNVLFQIITYLSKHHNKELGPTETFDKMGNVTELIRNILQYIKHYKITTKNPKDTKITRELYTNVLEPLHAIQKDTPIINFEKTLVSIAKYILKVADRETPIEHSAVGDDMIEGHRKLKLMFNSYPTDDYSILKNILNKTPDQRVTNKLRLDYIARVRKEYEKTNKNSSKATLIQPQIEPGDEWLNDNKPTEEDLFQDFLQDHLESDFEHLWDTSFKQQWLADYKNEVEQQRASLAHLKESVNKTIKYIFIKG